MALLEQENASPARCHCDLGYAIISHLSFLLQGGDLAGVLVVTVSVTWVFLQVSPLWRSQLF